MKLWIYVVLLPIICLMVVGCANDPIDIVILEVEHQDTCGFASVELYVGDDSKVSVMAKGTGNECLPSEVPGQNHTKWRKVLQVLSKLEPGKSSGNNRKLIGDHIEVFRSASAIRISYQD